MMQIKLTGYSHRKLDLVKRLKVLTGWNLTASKDWIDDFDKNAPRNAGMVNPYGDGVRQDVIKTLTIIGATQNFEWYKQEFESFGMIALPARDEILSELLDTVYDSECKYIFICLGVKYKIVKGSYEVDDDTYVIKMEEGIREYEGVHSIDNKIIKLPKPSTIIEE